MKREVNSISIESENGIFLFILCTPCALEGFNEERLAFINEKSIRISEIYSIPNKNATGSRD